MLFVDDAGLRVERWIEWEVRDLETSLRNVWLPLE